MAFCAPTGAVADLGIHQTDQPSTPVHHHRSKALSGRLAFHGDPV
jgi:hypothetical protein